MKNSKCILLCGFGSGGPRIEAEFTTLVHKFKKRYPSLLVSYGFLEFSSPSLYDAIDDLYVKGGRDIVAIPVSLFPGVHLKFDMPQQLEDIAVKYDDLSLRLAQSVGVCDHLIHLGEKLVGNAEGDSCRDRKDTCLVGLGVGASLPDVNADVAKLTRLVMENSTFGFCMNGFISQLSYPGLNQVMDIVERLPFKKVVFMPFVMFSDVLMTKVQSKVDEFGKHSDKTYYVTGLMGGDDLIFEALNDRLCQVVCSEWSEMICA
ncbi:hypothetical protein K5X82_12350 [Halosquirtibacter xylanolyticus]|uniref:sirohydrochlorin chelatase n=1 Tax=Halosquirtibacter xylanolyticus TaxID=3374599 RepID=UPI003747BEA3|nr:hypothetical protein K5X82_12350 [Prolixibacteraceae bacterium]